MASAISSDFVQFGRVDVEYDDDAQSWSGRVVMPMFPEPVVMFVSTVSYPDQWKAMDGITREFQQWAYKVLALESRGVGLREGTPEGGPVDPSKES